MNAMPGSIGSFPPSPPSASKSRISRIASIVKSPWRRAHPKNILCCRKRRHSLATSKLTLGRLKESKGKWSPSISTTKNSLESMRKISRLSNKNKPHILLFRQGRRTILSQLSIRREACLPNFPASWADWRPTEAQWMKITSPSGPR